MFLPELLAVLSISAATGIRLALPLLLIGLMSGPGLWSNVPLLSSIPPTVVLGLLGIWSVAELVLSKDHATQRLFQSVEMLLSPLVGTIAGVAVARTVGMQGWGFWLAGVISALLAMAIQLVQLGWSYRPKRPPLWSLFVLDGLCIVLAFLAFDSPHGGGLIALILLWMVTRTSNFWRRWPKGK